jgi:hypothetical protein
MKRLVLFDIDYSCSSTLISHLFPNSDRYFIEIAGEVFVFAYSILEPL